jgi:hypothetical protein
MGLDSFIGYFKPELYQELFDIWKKVKSQPKIANGQQILQSKFEGVHYFCLPFIVKDDEGMDKVIAIVEKKARKLSKHKNSFRQKMLKTQIVKAFCNLLELSIGASLEGSVDKDGDNQFNKTLKVLLKKAPFLTEFVFNALLAECKEVSQQMLKKHKSAGTAYSKRHLVLHEDDASRVETFINLVAEIKDVVEETPGLPQNFSPEQFEVNLTKTTTDTKQERFRCIPKEEVISSIFLKMMSPLNLNKALLSPFYDSDFIDDSISVMSELSLRSEFDTKKSEKVTQLRTTFENFWRDNSQYYGPCTRAAMHLIKISIIEYQDIAIELEDVYKPVFIQEQCVVDQEEIEKEILEMNVYTNLSTFFNLRTVTEASRQQLLDNLVIQKNLKVLLNKDKFGNYYFVNYSSRIFKQFSLFKLVLDQIAPEAEKNFKEIGDFILHGTLNWILHRKQDHSVDHLINFELDSQVSQDILDIEAYATQFLNGHIKVLEHMISKTGEIYRKEKLFRFIPVLAEKVPGFLPQYFLQLYLGRADLNVMAAEENWKFWKEADTEKIEHKSGLFLKVMIECLTKFTNPTSEFQIEKLTYLITRRRRFQKKKLNHFWSKKVQIPEAQAFVSDTQYLISKVFLELVDPFALVKNLDFFYLVKLIVGKKLTEEIFASWFKTANPQQVQEIRFREQRLDLIIFGLRPLCDQRSYEEVKTMLEEQKTKEFYESIGVEVSFDSARANILEKMEDKQALPLESTWDPSKGTNIDYELGTLKRIHGVCSKNLHTTTSMVSQVHYYLGKLVNRNEGSGNLGYTQHEYEGDLKEVDEMVGKLKEVKSFLDRIKEKHDRMVNEVVTSNEFVKVPYSNVEDLPKK